MATVKLADFPLIEEIHRLGFNDNNVTLFLSHLLQVWKYPKIDARTALLLGVLSQCLSNLLVTYRDNLADRPICPHEEQEYAKLAGLVSAAPDSHGALDFAFAGYFLTITSMADKVVSVTDKTTGESRSFYVEDEHSGLLPLETYSWSRGFSFSVKNTAMW